MNTDNKSPRRSWLSADFLSPKDFVRHAILLLLAFVVVQLCGLRDYTSILNGTVGSVNIDPNMAALLGVLYVFIYLGAILGVPVLLIAAALLKLWEKWKSRRMA